MSDDQISKRDTDWILAIGHALGLDSGYEVPIVPEVEPFKELFAAVRNHALASAEQRIAALQGDAERLDWLETHASQVDHYYPIAGNVSPVWTYRHNVTGFFRDATNLRVAIDAARQQEAQTAATVDDPL